MRRGLAIGVAALALAGCGGSGASSQGRLAIRVAWPAPKGRVIPAAAQSVRVQVLKNSIVTNEAILTPASPQTSFSEVPTGSVTVKAVAFPTVGATGTPMATGQVAQSVAVNGVATVDLTMASTIDRLAITPSTLSLTLGASQQLTATAYDASNAVVLTAPSDIAWSSSGLLMSVSATGLVQANSVGVGSITATDATSGKSATLPVSIHL